MGGAGSTVCAMTVGGNPKREVSFVSIRRDSGVGVNEIYNVKAFRDGAD